MRLRLPLALSMLAVAWLLLPFLSTVLAAVVVVMVAWPLHVRIRARMRGYDALAVLVTMLLLIVGVFSPIVTGAVIVVGEVAEIFPSLAATAEALPSRVAAWLDGPSVAPFVTRLLGDQGAPSDLVGDRLQAAVAPALQQVGGLAQDLINNVGAALVRAILFLLVLATLLHAGEPLAARVRALLPVEDHVAERTWASLSRFARGFVLAAAVVAVVQGTLASVGYAIAGVERSLLWGVLTGLASVVPFVGTSLVWIPLALLQVARGDVSGAAVTAAWSLLVVSSVDNVVRPLVIGQAAKVHPAMIFLAVFGGLATLGVSGLLVGPMLMATMLALLEQYEEQQARAEETPPTA